MGLLLPRRVALFLLLATPLHAGSGKVEPAGEPVTVGAIGLALAHPERPGTVERLSRGLHHADAAVRAAAARAAASLGAHATVADLTQALQAETNVEAAQEEAHALALLGDGTADQVLIDAAARLKPRLGQAIADGLVLSRGPAGLALLPRLRPLDDSALESVLRVGGARRSEALVPLAVAAVRENDAVLWRAVLEAGKPEDWAAYAGLAEATLSAASAGLREATYEHLAVVARGGPLAPGLAEALTKAVETNGDAVSGGGAAAGYELLRRAQGQPPKGTVADAQPGRGPQPKAGFFLAHPELAPLLTGDEMKVLLPAAFAAKALTPLSSRAPDLTKGMMRTAWALPTGFAKATLAAGGCHPGDQRLAVAQVAYRPDGRPLKVGLFSKMPSDACQEAVGALFSAAAAPLWRLADLTAPDVLMLRLDETGQECAEGPEPVRPAADDGTALHVGGKVEEPRRIRSVEPIYPEWVRAQRVEGLVILEAQIAASGCVRSMRILESAHPGLAAAALAAVGQWRYAPTLLDGVAVPVVMTVTVNFRMN